MKCFGNNGCIVDETADLQLASRSLAFEVVGKTGQRCTCRRRVIAQKAIQDELVKYTADAFSQIKLGDPREADAIVGPLIDPLAVDYFETAVKETVELGGTVAYDGSRIDRPGYYVKPTIITNCQSHWDCVQRETFVPIIYVMSYEP